MTPITNRHASVALLLMGTLAGCSGYEQNSVQSITGPLPGAFIRFANFSVSSPGVNFYANDIKLTAVATTVCSPPPTVPNPACATTGVESTTGTAAGAFATSSTGLYSAIAPGAYALSGRIAAATDKDLQISKVSTSIENGKFYTYYQSGIYDATVKTTDAFIVADPIPPTIDYTQAYVRLVNAVSSSQTVILYARNQTSGTELAVGGSTAYKSASAFVALPTGLYDLSTRSPDGINTITRTGVTFSAGRVYTVTARAATATTFALDNTANR